MVKIFEVYECDVNNGNYTNLLGLVKAKDFIKAKHKMADIKHESYIYVSDFWGAREIKPVEVQRRINIVRNQLNLLTNILT
jgi:hypothetical protein